MATEAQIAANARNAQLSTGPKTEEGKERSSRNRTVHGFRAVRPVLRTFETEREWEEHYESWLEDLEPMGRMEHQLVYTIALASWVLDRAVEIEVEMLNRLADSDLELWRTIQTAALGHCPPDSPEAIESAKRKALPSGDDGALLMRYRTDWQRVFWRAQAELRKVQSERKELAAAVRASNAYSVPPAARKAPIPKPAAEPAHSGGVVRALAPPSPPIEVPRPPAPEPPSQAEPLVKQQVAPQLGSNGAAAAKPQPHLSRKARRMQARDEKERLKRQEAEKRRAGASQGPLGPNPPEQPEPPTRL